MDKCILCNKEKEDLNEHDQCQDCLEDLDQTVTQHEKKWARSEIKDISKFIDRKLAKNAKREKKLKLQEEKELEEHEENFTHDHADQHANSNTSTTQKVVFGLGVTAVVVGIVIAIKQKGTHE